MALLCEKFFPDELRVLQGPSHPASSLRDAVDDEEEEEEEEEE